MDSKNLYISEIYANQGPTLKRIRPAAKGSAVRIRKKNKSYNNSIKRETIERRRIFAWDKKCIHMD